MNAFYLFALATVIATTGMGIVIRNTLQKVSQQPKEKATFATKMFLGVALIEVVPIICLILGFINLEKTSGSHDIPLLVTVLFTIGNAGWCIAKKHSLTIHAKEKETKDGIKEVTLLGLGLILAIPIISIVAMFLPNGM